MSYNVLFIKLYLLILIYNVIMSLYVLDHDFMAVSVVFLSCTFKKHSITGKVSFLEVNFCSYFWSGKEVLNSESYSLIRQTLSTNGNLISLDMTPQALKVGIIMGNPCQIEDKSNRKEPLKHFLSRFVIASAIY